MSTFVTRRIRLDDIYVDEETGEEEVVPVYEGLGESKELTEIEASIIGGIGACVVLCAVEGPDETVVKTKHDAARNAINIVR